MENQERLGRRIDTIVVELGLRLVARIKSISIKSKVSGVEHVCSVEITSTVPVFFGFVNRKPACGVQEGIDRAKKQRPAYTAGLQATRSTSYATTGVVPRSDGIPATWLRGDALCNCASCIYPSLQSHLMHT